MRRGRTKTRYGSSASNKRRPRRARQAVSSRTSSMRLRRARSRQPRRASKATRRLQLQPRRASRGFRAPAAPQPGPVGAARSHQTPEPPLIEVRIRCGVLENKFLSDKFRHVALAYLAHTASRLLRHASASLSSTSLPSAALPASAFEAEPSSAPRLGAGPAADICTRRHIKMRTGTRPNWRPNGRGAAGHGGRQ